jgi:hypothetical protein
MAGMGIDNALPKLIPAKTHAIIDYIHAGANFAAAALFRNRDRRASYAAFGLGASVLANALMTDYPLGAFRLYSFKVHGAMDYGVAAASAAIPGMLQIEDSTAARFFHLQGAGEALIAGVSNYDDDSGSKRRRRFRLFSGRKAA